MAIKTRKAAGYPALTYETDSDEEEEGDELLGMIDNHTESLFFMYVTDAGMSCYDYVKHYDGSMEPQKIINATRKLATNYQKLAIAGVGHYDMHSNNIMCRIKNGELCLSIIDFGFGFAIENSIRRNVLHFLFSLVNFDNISKTHISIRECDPVHYNMFVMCFAMLRRSLNSSKNPTMDRVQVVLHDLHDLAFSDVESTTYDEDLRNFKIFEKSIIRIYKDFYSRDRLQEIWKRVCEKTFWAIERFQRNRPEGMQEFSARTRANDPDHILPPAKKYVADNVYKYASKEQNAFSIIFDDFSMAFYNREGQPCDQLFLRKKFDEFSIACVCVFMLNKFGLKDKSGNAQIFKNEDRRLRKAFSSPNFFLRNDGGDMKEDGILLFANSSIPVSPRVMSDNDDSSDSSSEESSQPIKRKYAKTPKYIPHAEKHAMVSVVSPPAKKKQPLPPSTFLYNAADSAPSYARKPVSPFSPFPDYMHASNTPFHPVSPIDVLPFRLGLDDIMHVVTTKSIERDMPGEDTNFGQDMPNTMFSPSEVDKLNNIFSIYGSAL
jgi:hypothetical protein